MKQTDFFKGFSLGLVWIWLALFALVPFCLVVLASFLSHDDTHLAQLPFTLNNYLELYDSLYFQIFARSFFLAGICALCCLLLGYPFAYSLSRLPPSMKDFAVLLIIIPFWTSSLIRSVRLNCYFKSQGPFK